MAWDLPLQDPAGGKLPFDRRQRKVMEFVIIPDDDIQELQKLIRAIGENSIHDKKVMVVPKHFWDDFIALVTRLGGQQA